MELVEPGDFVEESVAIGVIGNDVDHFIIVGSENVLQRLMSPATDVLVAQFLLVLP